MEERASARSGRGARSSSGAKTVWGPYFPVRRPLAKALGTVPFFNGSDAGRSSSYRRTIARTVASHYKLTVDELKEKINLLFDGQSHLVQVEATDGTEADISAGDTYRLDPGHDRGRVALEGMAMAMPVVRQLEDKR